MFFTFTILLSLIFSSPQKEPAKSNSSETKNLPGDIREFDTRKFQDYLQFLKLPCLKKDFIYTPPPGIDYKIKIFKPDSTVDYKIKYYNYIDKSRFKKIFKRFCTTFKINQ